jgi:hypothetical protein
MDPAPEMGIPGSALIIEQTLPLFGGEDPAAFERR